MYGLNNNTVKLFDKLELLNRNIKWFNKWRLNGIAKVFVR